MNNTSKPRKIDRTKLKKVEVPEKEEMLKAGQKFTIGKPISFYIPDTVEAKK